jgi:hypothetical protein
LFGPPPHKLGRHFQATKKAVFSMHPYFNCSMQKEIFLLKIRPTKTNEIKGHFYFSPSFELRQKVCTAILTLAKIAFIIVKYSEYL